MDFNNHRFRNMHGMEPRRANFHPVRRDAFDFNRFQHGHNRFRHVTPMPRLGYDGYCNSYRTNIYPGGVHTTRFSSSQLPYQEQFGLRNMNPIRYGCNPRYEQNYQFSPTYGKEVAKSQKSPKGNSSYIAKNNKAQGKNMIINSNTTNLSQNAKQDLSQKKFLKTHTGNINETRSSKMVAADEKEKCSTVYPKKIGSDKVCIQKTTHQDEINPCTPKLKSEPMVVDDTPCHTQNHSIEFTNLKQTPVKEEKHAPIDVLCKETPKFYSQEADVKPEEQPKKDIQIPMDTDESELVGKSNYLVGPSLNTADTPCITTPSPRKHTEISTNTIHNQQQTVIHKQKTVPNMKEVDPIKQEVTQNTSKTDAAKCTRTTKNKDKLSASSIAEAKTINVTPPRLVMLEKDESKSVGSPIPVLGAGRTTIPMKSSPPTSTNRPILIATKRRLTAATYNKDQILPHDKSKTVTSEPSPDKNRVKIPSPGQNRVDISSADKNRVDFRIPDSVKTTHCGYGILKQEENTDKFQIIKGEGSLKKTKTDAPTGFQNPTKPDGEKALKTVVHSEGMNSRDLKKAFEEYQEIVHGVSRTPPSKKGAKSNSSTDSPSTSSASPQTNRSPSKASETSESASSRSARNSPAKQQEQRGGDVSELRKALNKLSSVIQEKLAISSQEPARAHDKSPPKEAGDISPPDQPWVKPKPNLIPIISPNSAAYEKGLISQSGSKPEPVESASKNLKDISPSTSVSSNIQETEKGIENTHGNIDTDCEKATFPTVKDPLQDPQLLKCLSEDGANRKYPKVVSKASSLPEEAFSRNIPRDTLEKAPHNLQNLLAQYGIQGYSPTRVTSETQKDIGVNRTASLDSPSSKETNQSRSTKEKTDSSENSNIPVRKSVDSSHYLLNLDAISKVLPFVSDTLKPSSDNDEPSKSVQQQIRLRSSSSEDSTQRPGRSLSTDSNQDITPNRPKCSSQKWREHKAKQKDRARLLKSDSDDTPVTSDNDDKHVGITRNVIGKDDTLNSDKQGDNGEFGNIELQSSLNNIAEKNELQLETNSVTELKLKDSTKSPKKPPNIIELDESQEEIICLGSFPAVIDLVDSPITLHAPVDLTALDSPAPKCDEEEDCVIVLSDTEDSNSSVKPTVSNSSLGLHSLQVEAFCMNLDDIPKENLNTPDVEESNCIDTSNYLQSNSKLKDPEAQHSLEQNTLSPEQNSAASFEIELKSPAKDMDSQNTAPILKSPGLVNNTNRCSEAIDSQSEELQDGLTANMSGESPEILTPESGTPESSHGRDYFAEFNASQSLVEDEADSEDDLPAESYLSRLQNIKALSAITGDTLDHLEDGRYILNSKAETLETDVIKPPLDEEVAGLQEKHTLDNIVATTASERDLKQRMKKIDQRKESGDQTQSDIEDSFPQEDNDVITKMEVQHGSIKFEHPGETVFVESRFGTIFSFQSTLTLESCGFTGGNSHMEKKLATVTTDVAVELLAIDGFRLVIHTLQNLDPISIWVLSLMSVIRCSQTTQKCYEFLLEAIDLTPWTPPVSAFARVFVNYGATLESLGIMDINMQDLKLSKVPSNNTGEQPAEVLGLGYPIPNLNLIYRVIGAVIHKRFASYTPQDLINLTMMVTRSAVDVRVTNGAVMYDCECCLSMLLNAFTERDWPNAVWEISTRLCNLTKDHHNQVYIVRVFSIVPRGQIVRRRLALLCLQKQLKNSSAVPSVNRPEPQVLEILSTLSGLTFKDVTEDFYWVASVIHLIELAIGNEPLKSSEKGHFEQLIMRLDVLRNEVRENVNVLDRAKLKDMMARVASKWRFMLESMGIKQSTLHSWLEARSHRAPVEHQPQEENSQSQADDSDTEPAEMESQNNDTEGLNSESEMETGQEV